MKGNLLTNVKEYTRRAEIPNSTKKIIKKLIKNITVKNKLK